MESEKEIEKNLIWAATKLVSIRANFGNAPFTTDDLDHLHNILGEERFIAAGEIHPKGEGVW